MDGVKFEFNNIMSLYKKNDSERRRSDILYDISKYIWSYFLRKIGFRQNLIFGVTLKQMTVDIWKCTENLN